MNESNADYKQYEASADHVSRHLREERILGDARDQLPTDSGHVRPAPSQIRIADPGKRPDFSQLVRQYRTATAVAGEVDALVYRSADRSLEFVLYRDVRGRVWFKSVSSVDAQVTPQGVRAVAVDADALCTPLWEYAQQVPEQYVGQRHPEHGSYVDAWAYLREIPEIQRWYRDTGTSMP